MATARRSVFLSNLSKFTIAVAALVGTRICAQSESAKEIVETAVHSELHAAQTDKSLWSYRDESDDPTKRSTYNAIETPQGQLRRLTALDGKPLTPAQQEAEITRLQHLVGDSSAQARAHKNSEHDDTQASAFLKMLPDAFTWTVVRRTPEAIVLNYVPNAAFHPPTIESRVLAGMAGEMQVSVVGNRIQSLRGRLTQDVLIGHGFFGHLYQGGTFNVQRREVEPGIWAITESHVHMNGKALLFKNIGENDDEVKTGWTRSDAHTLAEAAKELGIP